MVKKIAVYGTYEAKVPVTQRYWKRRRDGVMQRYWKKTKRTRKTVGSDARHELPGKGRDLYKAVMLAHRYMPKGFVDVAAEKFLKHPKRYGVEGSWIEREVES